MSGAISYHAGYAAEEIVADHYWRRGRSVVARRWRGRGGKAASKLGQRQMARLCRAATEFVAALPKGQLTPMRFDLAVVDGTGAVEIVENAFMAG